jgi:hypothetical protein
VPLRDPGFRSEQRSFAMKRQQWRTVSAPDHLDVAEACGAETDPESLECSLFRGEPRCQPERRIGRTGRVFLLTRCEKTLRKVRAPRQNLPEAIHIHCIDAYAEHGQ